MEIYKPGKTWRMQCILQYSTGLDFLNFLYTSLLWLLRGLRLMCGFLTRRNASDFFFFLLKSLLQTYKLWTVWIKLSILMPSLPPNLNFLKVPWYGCIMVLLPSLTTGWIKSSTHVYFIFAWKSCFLNL